MNSSESPILEISGLSVAAFDQGKSVFTVLRNVSFSMKPGQTLGLVGESGSGKTTIALSVLRLLPSPLEVQSGTIRFQGRALLQLTRSEIGQVRGAQIGMVFQEPLSVLNPLMRISDQLAEAMRYHLRLPLKEAVARGVELLDEVGIPEPSRCLKSYPHELSGGQRQRVLIAAAVACRPNLLICDEPTSSVDGGTREKILALLERLKDRYAMSILLISHDLSIVTRMAGEYYCLRDGVLERQR